MTTPSKEGKGFAGLTGWMVDNEADLSLARTAVRRVEAGPAPVSPSKTQATKPIPESNPSAPPQKSGGMSWAAVVWFVIISLIVVLTIAAVNTQPQESNSDWAEDAAAGDAEATVADAASGSDGLPAFDPVVAYVTAENANVRSGAGGGFPVVGTLPQMSQVTVTGRDGSWSQVEASVDGVPLAGYISAKLLLEGGADEARGVVCDVMQSARPYSGEVLLQNRYGDHRLTVNAGATDALVKLRSSGVTSLAFYVRAGESGTVESVPNGTYQIMFATGEGFSRKCLEFVTSMEVISDPSPQTFEVTSDGFAEYYSTATYTLTRQTGGNFRPQTIDSGSFRE